MTEKDTTNSGSTGNSDGPEVSDFEFNVVAACLAAQLDRIDKIDTKVAAVVAALMAAIGFAVASDKSVLDYAVSLLYLVPLGLVVSAFRSQTWDDAPKPRYFSDHFQRVPNKMKRVTINGKIEAFERNKKRLVTKGRRTNLGLLLAFLITLAFVSVRLVEVYLSPEVPSGTGQQLRHESSRPNSTGTPVPTARP